MARVLFNKNVRLSFNSFLSRVEDWLCMLAGATVLLL